MNPKRKGNQWERESAKLLSLIISNGETDKVFWRTASSGAFATIHNTDLQAGDLTIIHPDYYFPYIVECKHLKINRIFPLPTILKKTLQKLQNKNFLVLLKCKFGKFVITNHKLFKSPPILTISNSLFLYKFNIKLKFRRNYHV